MEPAFRPRRAVLSEEILMHSVAVPKPSDAGVTGASTPPIGRYLPVPVQAHEADPDAPRWPGA